MPTPRATVQKLTDIRDQIRSEIDALTHRLQGVELSIAALTESNSCEDSEVPKVRSRRGNVKTALLDLLDHVGSNGLNAHTAVELAAARGVSLDRNTISSLLSRLKRDGVVEHDGERYKLKVPRKMDVLTQAFPITAQAH